MQSFHRPTEAPHGERKDLTNLKRMLPFLWSYKGRVFIALSSLMLAKVAIVSIPLILKEIVDAIFKVWDLVERKAWGEISVVAPSLMAAIDGYAKVKEEIASEYRDEAAGYLLHKLMEKLAPVKKEVAPQPQA